MPNINILVDTSQPLFPERLVEFLHNEGVSAKLFVCPKSKVSLEPIKWILRLLKDKANIIHFLWGDNNVALYIIPKLLGKKVVIHWVGTDVLRVKKKPLVREVIKRVANLHLTVSSGLAEELKQMGIKATVIPLTPTYLPKANPTWPPDRVVHVYLPEGKGKFYGAEITFKLAREMPDVNFLITANNGNGMPQLPNVTYLGWVEDMEMVWSKVRVYLRLTKHDGMPLTVIEALQRGRYVIWSYEFPHCMQALSVEDAKKDLEVALEQKGMNVDGMVYTSHAFNPPVVAQQTIEQYRQLLERK
jgi:hypothetical protein